MSDKSDNDLIAKIINELDKIKPRGSRGYGFSHPVIPRKPIMNLGRSYYEREYDNNQVDDEQENVKKKKKKKAKVKISKAFHHSDYDKIINSINELIKRYKNAK